jgi:hypothetical protein
MYCRLKLSMIAWPVTVALLMKLSIIACPVTVALSMKLHILFRVSEPNYTLFQNILFGYPPNL